MSYKFPILTGLLFFTGFAYSFDNTFVSGMTSITSATTTMPSVGSRPTPELSIMACDPRKDPGGGETPPTYECGRNTKPLRDATLEVGVLQWVGPVKMRTPIKIPGQFSDGYIRDVDGDISISDNSLCTWLRVKEPHHGLNEGEVIMTKSCNENNKYNIGRADIGFYIKVLYSVESDLSSAAQKGYKPVPAKSLEYSAVSLSPVQCNLPFCVPPPPVRP